MGPQSRRRPTFYCREASHGRKKSLLPGCLRALRKSATSRRRNTGNGSLSNHPPLLGARLDRPLRGITNSRPPRLFLQVAKSRDAAIGSAVVAACPALPVPFWLPLQQRPGLCLAPASRFLTGRLPDRLLFCAPVCSTYDHRISILPVHPPRTLSSLSFYRRPSCATFPPPRGLPGLPVGRLPAHIPTFVDRFPAPDALLTKAGRLFALDTLRLTFFFLVS